MDYPIIKRNILSEVTLRGYERYEPYKQGHTSRNFMAHFVYFTKAVRTRTSYKKDLKGKIENQVEMLAGTTYCYLSSTFVLFSCYIFRHFVYT